MASGRVRLAVVISLALVGASTLLFSHLIGTAAPLRHSPPEGALGNDDGVVPLPPSGGDPTTPEGNPPPAGPISSGNRGACCLPDGTCRVVTRARCVRTVAERGLSGVYLGDNSNCTSVNTVPPDIDCWQTARCEGDPNGGHTVGTTMMDFCRLVEDMVVPPFPTDFFAPGSGDVRPLLILGGDPAAGEYDTKLARLQPMVFQTPLPDTQMTPIQILALHLKSCEPILVPIGGNDTFWDVFVDLSGPRVDGTNPNAAVPDCPDPAMDNFTTSDLVLDPAAASCGTRYTLTVGLAINHPRVGDLVVTLENVGSGLAPVTLIRRVGLAETNPFCTGGELGGNANADVNVVFDDSAGAAIEPQLGPLNLGTHYRPNAGGAADALSNFSANNVDICGTWRLTVHDGQHNMAGTLVSWGLTFTPPAQPIGTMTVTKTHCNGGTFQSEFGVYPRFKFVRQDTGDVRWLDTGLAGNFNAIQFTQSEDSNTWMHEPFVPPVPCLGQLPPDQRRFFPGMLNVPDANQLPRCVIPVTHGGRICVGHCHKVAVHQVVGGCCGTCCLPDFGCIQLGAEFVPGSNPPTVQRSARQLCLEVLNGKYMGDLDDYTCPVECPDGDFDGLADLFETNRPLACCQQPATPWVVGTNPNDADTDGDNQCDGCEVIVLNTSACDAAVPVVGGPGCPDCNGNGVCDPCDLFAPCGLSMDCNGNGVPDECDINPADPDGNGRVSRDCNGNGIPDECEVCDPPPAQAMLNEIRIDQPGTDNDEYVEIAGPPGTPLAGLTVVVIGDGTGGSGVIEAVVPLTGNIPADGYYLVVEPTHTLAPPIQRDQITAANGLNFENGDNVTFLLVQGFSGANGQDLDTNDDCVLDVEPWTTVLDRVALIVEPNPPTTTECHYGQNPGEIVGPDGAFVPGHVYRCGVGDNSWKIGLFDPARGQDTPGVCQ